MAAAGLGADLTGPVFLSVCPVPVRSAKNRVALVDFPKVVVARDVDADVKILDQTWGDYDSVGIRVVTRYDAALLQPHAVTLLTEA
jgi:HK97 family phage major capsid protein